MAIIENYTFIPNRAFQLKRNNKQNYKNKPVAIINCELIVGHRPNPQRYPWLSSTWVQLWMTATELDNVDQEAHMKWLSCWGDHRPDSCEWCRNLSIVDQASAMINTLAYQIH